MIEVRCYLPKEIYNGLIDRCENLEISKSEYLRLLATLDVLNGDYKKVEKCLNMLTEHIVDIKQKLGMYAEM